ncbi:peptidase domain-containing ABC transporter [Algoriphagus antarcticus]|uniref:ATP-binding cassette subfamily B protein n=1 Tax=Algoriphagus antarcticus TaxID=238540 RepID=A0A3E0DP56_9BACT|nr:peptidase domain-containing ABC transporter [Algoriphagus antarcticus]REG84720.1 ATP-binding cassette subfamily B protein [Algoriphagus antarcticus]
MKFSPKKIKKHHVSQLGEYACGLACLCTISRYYGAEFSQEKLRDISGTSQSGTTLLGLIQAAQRIGYEAKGFEAELKHLAELEGPAILHVVQDQNREHYLVYFGLADGKHWVSDPGVGILGMEESELTAQWKSGILLRLQPTEALQNKAVVSQSKKRWFVSLIAEDIPILIVATVIGSLMAGTGLSTAIFSQRLIDDFLPNQSYEKAIMGVVALGFLLSFRAILGYIQGVFMARQGRDLNVRIVASFIERILRLPMSYFRGYSTGDLIARMNDSLRIRNTVSLITGTVIINILVVVVSLAFVFYQSSLIGFICLLGVFFFLIAGWKYHAPILAKQKEVMAAHALNESQYVDSLTGMHVLRSYGKEQEYQQRIEQVYGMYQGKGYDLAIIGNNFSFWTQLIVAIFLSLLFGAGVYLIFQGELLLGELMALVSVGSTIVPAVAGLVVANIQFQEAKVAFDRLFEIAGLEVESDQEIEENNDFKADSPLLELDQVSFRYPGRTQILKGLSFQLEPGAHLALFAPVGKGKSTLVDLIQRFYDPESGAIRWKGQDARHTSVRTWRKALGVVNQKEKIFNSTVFDNIVLSSDLKEQERIAKVGESLGLWNLFHGLPQGAMTLCGEDGRNLSGGQRQLVGIVRALVREPQLLILDEATAAMDWELEEQLITMIRHYLQKQQAGLLMITHQPSLAARADRILLLKDYQIAQSGTHEALMLSENDYSRAINQILQPNQ